MEEKWTISEAEKSLLGISFDWIQQKIVRGEGFSVLLVSDHPSGRKMSKYTMESVEAALVQCKAELRTDLNDATAYALATTFGSNRKAALLDQCLCFSANEETAAPL